MSHFFSEKNLSLDYGKYRTLCHMPTSIVKNKKATHQNPKSRDMVDSSLDNNYKDKVKKNPYSNIISDSHITDNSIKPTLNQYSSPPLPNKPNPGNLPHSYNISNSIKKVSIGKCITFGQYMGVKLDWQVLKVEQDKALIISRRGIDSRPYHSIDEESEWSTCSLNRWLNTEFIEAAFSSSEKKRIFKLDDNITSWALLDDSMSINEDDKIFLLNRQEAERYFKTDSDRICSPTDHALKNGAIRGWMNGNCSWWLRSAGYFKNEAQYVFDDGSIDVYGVCVSDKGYSVRPVLVLSI